VPDLGNFCCRRRSPQRRSCGHTCGASVPRSADDLLSVVQPHLLARPVVASVIISHGTDTREETAYWFDLTVVLSEGRATGKRQSRLVV